MSQKKANSLKVIPLGGLYEIGKNMTAYEYGEDIVLVDCGMSFPEDEMLGIDVVIPDITYLKKNRERVRGIVLTHGHEDHIGAIPYVLGEMNVPIYGTKLTLGLVERKCSEYKNLDKLELHVVHPGDKIKLGHIKVELIHVSHSIPGAVALCLHTPLGRVIHSGDFKVDYTPIDGQRIDLNKFAELGSKGVLLMLCESTNVQRPGHTMSESRVGQTIENIFAHRDGRIFVASFASNVHRIQQIINACLLYGRKVAFSGRSMINVSNVALDTGHLKVPEGVIIDIRDIDRYPENEVCLITTGSQGETMSALARMANGEHRQVKIMPGDTIVLSSSPIPGNEKSVYNIINLLNERGADIIYESLADVHVSGHAKQQELMLIHSLVQPKYFMPMHGEYSMLKEHKEMAIRMGMDEEDVFILKNGDVLEITRKGAQMAQPVPHGNVLIDGLGIGDVGNIVLRDRKHLAEDGLMVVVVAFNDETGEVISGPDLISRGFVYVRESEDLMDGAKKEILKALEKCKTRNIREWSTIKAEIRDTLRTYLYQNTKRSPMILPIIMDV